MDLDSLIIAVFCLVDDSLRQVAPPRIRRRGPCPVLADSEVLTIEVEMWQRLVERTGCDPSWAMVDSFPVTVCRFARAPRCRRFRGEAGYGHDHASKQVFYGFRLHARVCWPGVVTRLSVCAASASDISLLEELTDATRGVCLADRAYWKPELAEWLRRFGLEMLVPYKKAAFDERPERAHVITSIRNRAEGNEPLRLAQLLTH